LIKLRERITQIHDKILSKWSKLRISHFLLKFTIN
jgi:hypothetical protein